MSVDVSLSCLERQQFDEAAFGIPFYRILTFDKDLVRSDISALRQGGRSFVVDCKCRSDDLDRSKTLQELGFRKVCIQIELVSDLLGPTEFDPEAQVLDVVHWEEDLIQKHARNFLFDRFALDPLLPREGHDKLYGAWIGNSLSGTRYKVLRIGQNFLTFDLSSPAKIDLVSVIDQGRGIGARLLNSLSSHAQSSGVKQFSVVTECENSKAINLYLKTGYKVSSFQSVFHLVKLER